MYGDFSRDSFDPSRRYNRVLMQQGRPLTDADWNEMVELLVREHRELVKSVIGWHGSSDNGLNVIEQPAATYKLQMGTYYVDGLKCCNSCVRDLTFPDPIAGDTRDHLVYLDVWEDSVSAMDEARLLEPSLGGADTSSRSTVSWGIRISDEPLEGVRLGFDRDQLIKAIKKKKDATDNPASAKPPGLEARWRKSGNQHGATAACEVLDSGTDSAHDMLYRIEIHNSGKPSEPILPPAKYRDGTATFKWSRDNGTTAAALAEVANNSTQLTFDASRIPRRPRPQFREHCWLELFDRFGMPANSNRDLLKIKSVGERSLTVATPIVIEANNRLIARDGFHRPFPFFIRQWDQNAKESDENPTMFATKAPNANSEDGWISIENGLQIRFQDAYCLEGDYWLIRVSSNGQVHVSNSSRENGTFSAARRFHHFSPLGTVKKETGVFTVAFPYRKQFAVSGFPDPDRMNAATCAPVTPTPVAPATPAPAPAAPPVVPVPAGGATCSIPVETRLPVNPVSLLSGEGARALKGYLSSPKDVTRRVPARYLNYEPQSDGYRRFRSPLLVSEILESSFEKYLAKVERCIDVSEAEWERVEADARADYALAAEFQSLVSSGQGFRPLIA